MGKSFKPMIDAAINRTREEFELADSGIADPRGDEEMISACIFASGVLRKRADELIKNKHGN